VRKSKVGVLGALRLVFLPFTLGMFEEGPAQSVSLLSDFILFRFYTATSSFPQEFHLLLATRPLRLLSHFSFDPASVQRRNSETVYK